MYDWIFEPFVKFSSIGGSKREWSLLVEDFMDHVCIEKHWMRHVDSLDDSLHFSYS